MCSLWSCVLGYGLAMRRFGGAGRMSELCKSMRFPARQRSVLGAANIKWRTPSVYAFTLSLSLSLSPFPLVMVDILISSFEWITMKPSGDVVGASGSNCATGPANWLASARNLSVRERYKHASHAAIHPSWTIIHTPERNHSVYYIYFVHKCFGLFFVNRVEDVLDVYGILFVSRCSRQLCQ